MERANQLSYRLLNSAQPFGRLVSHWLHQLAVPPARVVAKTGVSPNVLTILGFFLNGGVAYLISEGHFALGGALVLFAGVFDLLDGAVARTTGKVSKFGALLDSTLDRYSEALLLFGLVIYFVRANANTEVILLFAAIVGSMLVSYVRARAEGLELDGEVGIMRRTVRICTLAVGLMSHQVLIALWLLAVLSNLTAGQRLFYVWQKTHKVPDNTSEL